MIVCSLKKLHVNVTTNLQSLLYLCLVLSGCVKHNRKFPCGNLLFRDRKLTRYHHCTISTWVQSENSIAEWLQHIRNKSIQAPWRPPLINVHPPPTPEASTFPIKILPYKNCTQLYSLPSELLHSIGIWHTGLVHHNKTKPVLVGLTQHHAVLCAPLCYKIKYALFK